MVGIRCFELHCINCSSPHYSFTVDGIDHLPYILAYRPSNFGLIFFQIDGSAYTQTYFYLKEPCGLTFFFNQIWGVGLYSGRLIWEYIFFQWNRLPSLSSSFHARLLVPLATPASPSCGGAMSSWVHSFRVMPSRIMLHRIWSPAGDNKAITSAKEKNRRTEFRTYVFIQVKITKRVLTPKTTVPWRSSGQIQPSCQESTTIFSKVFFLQICPTYHTSQFKEEQFG